MYSVCVGVIIRCNSFVLASCLFKENVLKVFTAKIALRVTHMVLTNHQFFLQIDKDRLSFKQQFGFNEDV